jgi:lipid-binding SYLF domain-containing protein
VPDVASILELVSTRCPSITAANADRFFVMVSTKELMGNTIYLFELMSMLHLLGCTQNRLLIPEEQIVHRPANWFASEEANRSPKRVCDSCAAGLHDCQGKLRQELSRANQELAVEGADVNAVSLPQINCLLQNEIVNATVMLAKFNQNLTKDTRELRSILEEVKGIVFLTTIKAGFLFTGCYGTGCVIVKLPDGSWSAPSALTITGVGCGWQIGAEVSDTMLFLPNDAAVSAFRSTGQLSVGAAVAGSVGPIGLGLQTDVSGGNKGVGANYSLLMPKGLFFGAAFEATAIATRKDVNRVYYGEDVSTTALLTGQYPLPKGAAPLYEALDQIMGTSFARSAGKPDDGEGGDSAPRYHTLDESGARQYTKVSSDL